MRTTLPRGNAAFSNRTATVRERMARYTAGREPNKMET
jgi:hypothetical protein